MSNFLKSNTSIDYSTKETLKNLKNQLPYKFEIKTKLQPLAIADKTIEVGDSIIITDIELKSENEGKTHVVKYSVTNQEGKNIELTMSGGVFMKEFIKTIPESDIIEKTTISIKEDIKNIL